jgi:hypothetical protein
MEQGVASLIIKAAALFASATFSPHFSLESSKMRHHHSKPQIYGLGMVWKIKSSLEEEND